MHTLARRSHSPAPPQGAANPASRSGAGLGGCAQVAKALACATRDKSVYGVRRPRPGFGFELAPIPCPGTSTSPDTAGAQARALQT